MSDTTITRLRKAARIAEGVEDSEIVDRLIAIIGAYWMVLEMIDACKGKR